MDARRRERGRHVMVICLLGALAAVTAACSSGPAARTVASLPATGPSPHGTAAQPPAGSYDQDIVRYTRCLRTHGLDVPDPVSETHNGRTGLSFVTPQATAANRPALAACNHFIADLAAAKAAGARTELVRWLPALIRYAACMRSHDIPMLDPGPAGQLNLGDVPGITSDFGRYSPQFRSADAACRHFLPSAVHDHGTGP